MIKPLLLCFQLTIICYSSCGLLEHYQYLVKHIILFGALGIAASTSYNYYNQSKRIKKNQASIDPNNINIVFDLHNVIVNLDYLEMIKKVYEKPRCLVPLILISKPSFLKDLYTLLKTSNVAEQYLAILGDKYSLVNSHVDTYIELSNAQKLIPSTHEVLQRLKQKNHKLFLFSNIGLKTYKQLFLKYSDIFNYFEGIHVASHENNWLQKPHQDSFHAFLKRFNIHPEQMLFIDDNHENIATAQKLGIHTIHYKSGQQLKTELNDLQIL